MTFGPKSCCAQVQWLLFASPGTKSYSFLLDNKYNSLEIAIISLLLPGHRIDQLKLKRSKIVFPKQKLLKNRRIWIMQSRMPKDSPCCRFCMISLNIQPTNTSESKQKPKSTYESDSCSNKVCEIDSMCGSRFQMTSRLLKAVQLQFNSFLGMQMNSTPDV